MKRNHFFFGYAGNKREEAERFFNLLNFEGITTIVEPFCGSCAISYYISTKINNLKYVLNDNNKHLIELLNICKDEKKIKVFEDKINNYYLNKIKISKEEYLKIINDDNIYGWFIKNKYYKIQPGLYPIGKKINKINLYETGIYKFLSNNDVELYCEDAINIYDKYKNNENVIIINDPPYISSHNDFYFNPSINIYEYVYNDNIKNYKANIYFILENNWIIQLLFNKFIINEYNKLYQTSKRKTTHIIIYNKKV